MATRVALRIEGFYAFQGTSLPNVNIFMLMDGRRLLTHTDTSGKKAFTVVAVCCIGGESFIGIAALFAMIMFSKYSLSVSNKKCPSLISYNKRLRQSCLTGLVEFRYII